MHFRTKAAQSPVLIAWLADVSLEFSRKCHNDDKRQAGVLSSCLWGLAEYFHVIKSADRFFTDAELPRLYHASHTFLYMFSEMSRESDDLLMWSHIPKMHQFHHLILDALDDRNNPRFFHCFGDEDMVGIMLRTARSCHSLTVVDSCVRKYATGLVARIHDCAHWMAD